MFCKVEHEWPDILCSRNHHDEKTELIVHKRMKELIENKRKKTCKKTSKNRTKYTLKWQPKLESFSLMRVAENEK